MRVSVLTENFFLLLKYKLSVSYVCPLLSRGRSSKCRWTTSHVQQCNVLNTWLQSCGIQCKKKSGSLFPFCLSIHMSGQDTFWYLVVQCSAGKTLAFGIPAMTHVLKKKKEKKATTPLCLVLSPTRELAQQVTPLHLLVYFILLFLLCVLPSTLFWNSLLQFVWPCMDFCN